MINNIYSNIQNLFTPTVSTPPTIQYFVITNFDAVRSGQTRQLHLSIPETLDVTQSNINMIARITLLGDTRKVQLHERVAALNFNEIVFTNGSEVEVSTVENLEIEVLKKKRMITSEDETETTADESEFRAVSRHLFVKIATRYSDLQQSLVKHFRQTREKEQAITNEDTRQRKIKNRIKRWNLRMDHWLKKEANRWEILKSLFQF